MKAPYFWNAPLRQHTGRTIEDVNATVEQYDALQKCCKEAAKEITEQLGHHQRVVEIASIIYRHMRYGREL